MALSNNPVTNRLKQQNSATGEAVSTASPARAVSNNPVTQRLTGATPTKADVISTK